MDAIKYLTMDPTSKNESGTLFFDRLEELYRTKEDGEVVERGGRQNVVRVKRGTDGSCYLRVTCIMLEVLNARIQQWPSAVSEDGQSISLWLIDHSLGQQFKRKFQPMTAHLLLLLR